MTAGGHSPDPSAPWRLLDGYHPVDDVYDEMIDASGGLRPHCARLLESLDALGQHEVTSRRENARRAIRENGVTYNVYGDSEGVDRSWDLDVIPFMISSVEWSRLEAGLIQRTRLLNQILADIYGPQRLVQQGLLPAALVFGNPAFLRPCRGITVPRDIYLHLHAVDLARRADGEWVVLADRTQVPVGAGYALENRIVLSRCLPEVFRDCQVQRVASFFRAHRDTLTALAPDHLDQPNIVVLTPGPSTETYFEHAYLARYLGFTLVEGGDLTVRDRRVFIKTLEGLQRVDVIFRRLDSSFCDPLELRGESLLGVAGLVEAVRAGHVVLANALGSGVIETAAIMAFLPGLCRHLLGEDLLLPSVPTRWCGQPSELEYVVDHLDQVVVKRAFPPGIMEPVFAEKLTERERLGLMGDMLARPDAFAAQDRVGLATTPVWLGNAPEPRAAVLRTYVGAAGDTYVVMPGGLSRVSSASDVPVVSMNRGGGSKDTWVLSDGPVGTASLLAPAGAAIRVERAGTDLPSRVADNLFWLGRYAERAEQTMRLARSVVTRLTDEDAADDPLELVTLLRVLVEMELLPARLAQPLPLRDLGHELVAFVFKPNPPTALRTTLNDLRRIATAVRDRLSVDTWRILSQLDQDFRLRRGRVQLDDALAHLNRMIMDLAAFSGMEMENMTRGHGWRFLDIGRRLERAINLMDFLRSTLAEASPARVLLDPLLEVADSTMTYRRRYFARPLLAPVLELLLTDEANARALAFQLSALSDHVTRLPRDPKAPSPTREEELIDHAISILRLADIDALCRTGEDDQRQPVIELIDTIDEDLRALSDALSYFYFSHAELRVS